MSHPADGHQLPVASARRGEMGACHVSVRDRLRPVFVTALELEAEVDVEQLRQRGHERWDSLGHLALVAAIEEEFDVELDSDQMIDMTSFERAESILRELGVNDG